MNESRAETYYPRTCYLLNRTPRQGLKWKALLEVLYELIGRPNPPIELAHLRVYGSRCYPLIHKEERKHKLDPRAHLGYLVGYEASNIYRVWVPGKKPNQVIRSRAVRFDEQLFFDPHHTDFAVELREQADEIFESITVKNGPHIFDLDSESEADSADGIDVLDSDDDTPVTTPAGSSGSSGSNGPPTEPKDTGSDSNPYLTPTSGQSERSTSEVSDASASSGPSGTITVRTAPAGTLNTPNDFSPPESAPESSQAATRRSARTHTFRGNYYLLFIHYNLFTNS